MTATQIINDARSAVESGKGLSGTGFWRLVTAIKSDTAHDRHIRAVAEIEQKAFRDWALLVVPLGLGTSVMVFGTVFGLVLIALAYPAGGTLSGLLLLGGTAILLVTTHGLAHLAVGTAVGIRFTAWFIGTLGRPQPGVKIDYESYLKTPASSRAWMHASGALATKAIPFLMLGAGLAADAPAWSLIALIFIGLVNIVTDVLWSTSASDWMKFRREMGFAQDS